MNYKKIYSKVFFVSLLISLITMTIGCSDDDDNALQPNYGYVQFKLYKDASLNKEGMTRAVSDKIELLHAARKVKVVMQHQGSTIMQTMMLNSYDADNAEFGLSSEKLQLMAGDYTVIGFYLYDKLDAQIYTGTSEADETFAVVSGGLHVEKLTVDAVERGTVSFKLVKEMLKVRSSAGAAYPFANIKMIDITLKNLFTQEYTTIKKVRVTYKEGFNDGSADADLYPGKNSETSYAECDTTIWLKAGSYQISSYTTFSDRNAKIVLETASLNSSKTFIVKDNEKTEGAEVPIRLAPTAEYIKDYMALREIWEKLDGKNWKYYGESNPMGSNWNFNKDIDMWGDQPGVGLDDDGRVSVLSVEGFGAKGVVPDAVGQLTKLKILSLGTHNEKLGGHIFSNIKGVPSKAQLEASRRDYENKFLKHDVRESLSEFLQESINSDPKQKPIAKDQRVSLKDIQVGVLTNQITGISRAVMRLTGLQQFFVANSPIRVEDFFRDIKPDSPFYIEKDDLSWANLTQLTDVEIYNCPNLTYWPEILMEAPELQMLTLASNQGISANDLKQCWIDLIEGASGSKVQGIYLSNNNLKEFPGTEYLSKMVKLGMLDCVNNQIETVHPFGKNVNITKLYLDNNKIKEITAADDGYFCGMNNVEGFSFAHNQLTKVPDIFNAKSVYVMGSIDFSYNQISGFENGDDHKGINASSVVLSNNKFTKFPSVLFKKNSPISTLILSANGLKEIKEGDLKGEKANYLSTIDFTYNKLTKLPDDFRATTLPYLLQFDLSFNSFSEFPIQPLNVSSLTSFAIRHQRDDLGNRTLRDWPKGLYTCPSLERFFIGSNDIRKIDDTISPNIFIFEIADNPNISIDMTRICPYIQAGAYMLIYDKTQDIRGCDALGIEK